MHTLSELRDVVRGLAEQGHTESVKGTWTLGQLCDHLAKTMNGSLPSGDLGPPAFSRLKQRLVRAAVFWTGRMPAGVPAPGPFQPEDGVSTEEGIAQITEAVQRFVNLPESERGAMTDSPPFGPMTYADWQRVHLIHARHHLSRFTGRRY